MPSTAPSAAFHPPHAGRLAAVLHRVFARQARAVAAQLSLGRVRAGAVPDLTPWVAATAAAARPVVLALFQYGILRSRARLAALGVGPASPFVPARRRVLPTGELFGMGKGVMWNEGPRRKAQERTAQPRLQLPEMYVRKAAPLSAQPLQPVTVGAAFDLFSPRVLDAVDAAVMEFCRATHETATVELSEAVRQLRALLKQGLPEGAAVAALAVKVREIFADPYRAFRLAATESSRAMNGGAYLNAKSNAAVTGKEWLASDGACPRCLEIMDKGVIPLEDPFFVDPKGGVYSVVQFPPLHPH